MEKPLVGRNNSFYEQLNSFINGQIENKKEFDNKFFYVISSFFAFSILLAELIGKENFYLILIAWGSNLIALVCHLVSYLMAIESHKEKMNAYIKIDERDEKGRENFFVKYIIKNESEWGKATIRTEIISYTLFVTAIIFLLLFSYFNLA